MKQKLLVLGAGVLLVALAAVGAFASHDVSGAGSDTHGIPPSNPVFHPDNGDGVCEHGETVVKITPSGNRVTVPCQAVSHGHGNGA
jgi:hypothetical protein